MLERAGKSFQRALVRWVDVTRRRAMMVVLAAVVATAALAYYTAAHLGINTSTKDMLSEDLPFRQVDSAFEAAFPQLYNTILLVIDGANADLAEDAAEALAARLKMRPELFDPVYEPGGDSYFKDNGLLYLETSELEDLADRLADAQPLLTRLASDPSLRGFFGLLTEAVDAILDGEEAPVGLVRVFERLSAGIEARSEGKPGRLSWRELLQEQEGSVKERRRFIVVKPELDFGTLQPAARALTAIREIAADVGFGDEQGLRLRLTGSAVLDHEELESVKSGASRAGILSLALVTVLLFWGLGSPRLVLAALLTLLAGLAWTAAFATAAVGHLNLISMAFAVLFIGLGVDFAIHFSLRYREEVAAGREHAEALRLAAGGVGMALTLCAAAAAIGFLSFLPTAFLGVAELGLISGVGMFIALFASMTLLPALLTLMPLKTPNAEPTAAARPLMPQLVERHARAIIGVAVALGAAALVTLFLTPPRFDFDPLNLKDPGTESMRTLRDLERESDRPPYTIEILAADLDQAAALARRLEGLDEVDEALTLHDFVPEDQEEKLALIDEMSLFLSPLLVPPEKTAPPGDDERRAALVELRGKLESLLTAATEGTDDPVAAPARRLARALQRFEARSGMDGQALRGLEAALVGSLPKRLRDLRRSLGARPVTIDDLPESLRSRRLAADGRGRVQVYPEEDIGERDALQRFVAAVQGLSPEATDTPVIIVAAGEAVLAAFRQATITALVLISALLLLLLRSLRDTAFVLTPLLLAGLLMMATTGPLGLAFNFANVIVLPLLLGLGVASGIHLVMRHRRDGGAGGLLETSTPRAVLFSALTTVGSFGSLAISSHRGTASMGLLLTIAIFYTLICSLVVLPALLARRSPERGAEGR